MVVSSLALRATQSSDQPQRGVHAPVRRVALVHRLRRCRAIRRRGDRAAHQTVACLVHGWPETGADAGQQRGAVRGAFVGRPPSRRRVRTRPPESRATAASERRRRRGARARTGTLSSVKIVNESRRLNATPSSTRANDVTACVVGGQSDERGAHAGIEMRRPLAHQVRRPQHAIRAGRHIAAASRGQRVVAFVAERPAVRADRAASAATGRPPA